MQKTGCTHIASLLSNLFDGDQLEKHSAATQDQIASNKYFISSIRNPWDWYLSLWTFGVQGKGGLMQRATKRNYLRSLKLTIRNPIRNYSSLFHELSKDITLWREVYDRSDNVESFRKWLKLVHNSNNSHIMSGRYRFTAITDLCGFMTLRYLRLCCRNVRELDNPRLISNYTDLVQFDKNNCFVGFFIRQESLEDDLCEAVEKGRPLTQEEKELIYGAKKINISKRSFLISDYYDEESIELIRNRDRLLIDKFDYSPPQIAEQGAALDRDSATLHPRQ